MSQSAMSMALIAAKSVPPSVLNSVVYIWVQCPSMSQALLPISSLPDSRICVITAALVGGEGTTPPTNPAVLTQIRESGKLLMGKSAWDIEGHWTQMYTTEFNTLGGTLFAAMGATAGKTDFFGGTPLDRELPTKTLNEAREMIAGVREASADFDILVEAH